MTKTRSLYQLELALPMPGRGEALRRDVQGIEAVTAMAERESPASTAYLMEAICAPDNIEAALRAVVRNKGAPGVDGITVKRLPGILKAHWSEIEDQLLRGRAALQRPTAAMSASSRTVLDVMAQSSLEHQECRTLGRLV